MQQDLKFAEAKSHLDDFVHSLTQRSKYHINEPKRLMFLCGANQAKNEPSERRKAIAKFIEINRKDWDVVYAEKVYNRFIEIGKSLNSLDFEHALVKYSDNVLIILESPSAFAELGAFSEKEIRKKVVVVNNSDFRSSESFINTGPIQAILESNPKSLLDYKMGKGVDKLDGIGTIFSSLNSILSSSKMQTQVSLLHCDLSKNENIYTLYLIHDLICISYCISYSEIIEILKEIFGPQAYNSLSTGLCVLEGIDAIKRIKIYDVIKGKDIYYYKSMRGRLFLRLDPPIKMIGKIRNILCRVR
jgi:hypothetical protein